MENINGIKCKCLDQGFLDYALGEIKKHKSMAWHMSNEPLADELFPFVLAKYPSAKLIKYDIGQHITVTKQAEYRLRKDLQSNITHLLNKINELTKAISTLQ